MLTSLLAVGLERITPKYIQRTDAITKEVLEPITFVLQGDSLAGGPKLLSIKLCY
jgi:hypothetical protein